MLRYANTRAAHYLLLTALLAVLYLPNLGTPSLWDIDEGNNASAAREMLESGNWVIPTFNGDLRVDKPALLYWLQILGYQWFGVNEFSARLPSALAAILAVLLVCELARRMFDPTTGLLAGVTLGGSVALGGAARFANPDALLNVCTIAAFLFFWLNVERPRVLGFLGFGVATGLAMLAKGPVGLVLPVAAVGTFALLTGRWRLLTDRRQSLAVLAFVLTAAPWYAWVGAETKGEFLRGFFLKHNVGRFTATMEGHAGSFLYYLPVLLIGFLPWSMFLGLTLWHTVREVRSQDGPDDSGIRPRDRRLYLVCWASVYLLCFSLSATKLPNYILPTYAPVAILTAATLEAWRRGRLASPFWATPASLAALALTGLAVILAALLVGGALPGLKVRGGPFAGMELLAVLGLLPLIGAAAGLWCWRRDQRGALLVWVAATGWLFVAGVAGWGCLPLERHKAPRELLAAVRIEQATHSERDVRIGAYRYFQPSLVFYAGREVLLLPNERKLREFLHTPLPVYVVVPATEWETLAPTLETSYRLVERRRDFYRNCDVVVVTNR